MAITELNHYFVRCNDLEHSMQWYCHVLGFEPMPRPPFPFPGHWLGVNGKVQVHMGPHGIEHADLYYIGSPPDAARDNSGVVDHIAFLAEDPASFRHRFAQMGIAHRNRALPDFDLYQMFIRDPDGLTIELNFFGMGKQADWGGEDYAAMPRAGT